MTAVVNPGQHVGGGTPSCCECERVFEERGATWAAAVATCAQVRMWVVGLVDVKALRSCATAYNGVHLWTTRQPMWWVCY